MSNITVEAKRLKGQVRPPPDKSISHRAVIIASLAQGKTQIKNLSLCEDCQHTIEAFKQMGVEISKDRDSFSVQGKGLDGLRKPLGAKLYLGNSGTSLRLILGVLAGQNFSCTLAGDGSLSRRPMKRVVWPLSLMGAKISGKHGAEFAPLTVQGGRLTPISYETPVASAQVKSAILLAGLYAEGSTVISEPVKSRDHTERMLKKFGADVSVEGLAVTIRGRAKLSSRDLEVPGDISAASFFLVGAAICPGSEVLIKSTGLNPTRTGCLDILQKMGSAISCSGQDTGGYDDETKGDITAKYSRLQAITIQPEDIPSLIDELPILMVAATQAEGETKIFGAGELRVKETDRISAMVSNLTKMGADIKSEGNDVLIRGPVKLAGNTVESFGDHRTAMSMAIAGLVASGRTTIKDIDCVNISFPGFFTALSALMCDNTEKH